jgi:sugar transferase (PEP-CTERM/EpsH1 system associated)
VRLLFLAHRVPDRPAKGDKIRAWHELRALASRHEVHLFALDDDPAGASARPEWAGEVASATIVPLRRLPARLRALRALAGGDALTAAHFAAPALRRALSESRARAPFDAAFVYSGAMAPLAEDVAPRVVDLVDVDSEKFRLYAERGTVGGVRRLACKLEAKRLRALEKRASEGAAATIVCTDEEAATLRGFASPRRLEVLGNGVDLDAFPFAASGAGSPRARDELLFVGALDYEANVDACTRLVRDVLPRIRRELPGARATLVGSRPTAAVRALAREPGVELHADVPAVQPFLQRATLALLPFSIARGVQNKALEALSSGLPLVAAREVTKGLHGTEGRDWLAGGDADELAREALRALRDAELREKLARAGRALVESRYAWKPLLDRLLSIVESAAASARAPVPAAGAQLGAAT